MKKLERKLYNLLLPEQKDGQHQYDLRRALLNCSYFSEDSRIKILSDSMKYYLTSKYLVATVTIGMVVIVGTVSNMAMDKLHAQETVAIEPVEANAQPIVASPERRSGRISSAVSSEIKTTAAEEPKQQPREVRMMSFAEISQLLQQAYANNAGTLMLELDSGIFIYSFSPPLEEEYVPSTFGVSSYTPAE